MLIREATPEDWPTIWPFFHEIVAAGETLTYPTGLAVDDAKDWWYQTPPNRTVVAVNEHSTILGTAKMNRNHMGNGAHVASATYLVDPAHSGQGVGRALVEYSVEWARAAGYRLMQFNAVVETNIHAIALYQSIGFRIGGTLPEGFHHPTQGYVGLHMMYRPL
ncbi:GNAT family N-acetyltransferase [Nocardia sp. NPDC058640]|uniref:GNAT family N-acetyltransferase n=1 Tax=Nocardia sp. NPDC058640 TaxID=3346571 RepID=UPI00365286EC